MSFNDFADIIVKTDNSNNDFEENQNSLQLIELLKQNLMKKSLGIPFSGNFEFVKTFGKELQPIDNNAENLVGLRNPYDLKIDNKLQLVFVVDFTNSRIVVFNLDGNYLYHFQTPQGPVSLFVDQIEDRLFVKCSSGIFSCNKKGENFKSIYESGRFFALTVDTITNYIYATDAQTNKVVVIDTKGNFKFEFKGNGEFNKPYGLTFNSKRELLVSDTHNNRIQVFNCNGQFIKHINAPFDKNWGIAVDKTNDNILTVDIVGQDIHILSEDGILIKSIKQKELQNPMGIDYCSVNGYVYVCGDGSNNVVIFK